jgi:hypothetical protein
MMGGGGVTVKFTPLLGTPPTVTTMLPVVAPAGTGTVILVELEVVGDARVPLNVTTLSVGEKLVPVTVTTVPTGPEVGLTLVTAGVIEKSTELLNWLPTTTET